MFMMSSSIHKSLFVQYMFKKKKKKRKYLMEELVNTKCLKNDLYRDKLELTVLVFVCDPA